MENKKIQLVEAVNERDIDLLILEEFNSNINFLEFFIKKNKLPEFSKNNISFRSVTEFGLGETDVLLSYIDKNQNKIFVLIENKLDAEFQNRQYERYIERAEKYKKENLCDKSFVILVAPENYIKSQENFIQTFSYENIIDFFSKDKNDKRFLFKIELLKIAIEKLRRGYEVVNSEVVQSFWKEYFLLREEKVPELKMKKPNQIPHESDWIRLKNADFTFVHKLRNGYFDIEFKSKNDDLKNEVLKIIQENSELVIYKSGNFAVRYNLEILDRTKDFYEQIDKIEENFVKINLINKFCKENFIF